jgi:hypothetical protein
MNKKKRVFKFSNKKKSQSLSGYVQNCNDIKQKLTGELKMAACSENVLDFFQAVLQGDPKVNLSSLL